MDYLSIAVHSYFTAQDAFCDENGTPNTDVPSMHWKNTFHTQGNETKVVVEITFNKAEDMEKIIEMGFKEGFTAALADLNELLAEEF